MTRSAISMGGFSLVEMMVALVAGMVVMGAVLTFTVSSVKANSDYVKSTRLMQELRNTSDFIGDELKRAGYDEAAMDYVANPAAGAASVFAPILVETTAGANCIVYAYDRAGGRQGKVDGGSGEIRAIRRSSVNGIGVIEVAESSSTVTPTCSGASPDYTAYPVSCNTTSGWCGLTDPRSINISNLAFNPAGVSGTSNGVQSLGSGGSGFNAMQLREFEVTLSGNLINDANVTRTLQANVKVRADCLRASISPACTVAPQITP
jgi:type II secretory pathway component PulJ